MALSFRQGVAVLLGLSVVTSGTLGCVALEEQVKAHPETAIGAGLGAAAGMLTGGLIFGNATGTLLGGLVGGLAGGAIGNVVEAQTLDRYATATRYHYTARDGVMLRIEAVEAHPTGIRAGDTVNLNMRFAVLARNAQQTIRVLERRQILYKGSVVGDSTLQVDRLGGTWTSSQPLTLPSNAASGRYQVVMSVKADHTEVTQHASFTVVR